jgi:hypothetical protein
MPKAWQDYDTTSWFWSNNSLHFYNHYNLSGFKIQPLIRITKKFSPGDFCLPGDIFSTIQVRTKCKHFIVLADSRVTDKNFTKVLLPNKISACYFGNPQNPNFCSLKDDVLLTRQKPEHLHIYC